ncbi:MAG: RHS repeat-associated core domain-containing protein [Phycisphaeraceae bacterium]|nr:RHS repeat-associated core domain-containing protein [Phycisphaeraceae bacterium]
MPLPRAIRLMVFLLLLALIASGMLTRSAHGSQVRGPSEHVHATGTVDFSDQLILSGSYASALPRGLGLSTDGNVIGFTGHVFDAETGLLLARLRVYDAVVLGRWLSRDPAGFVDGMYVYVRGNPLVWWDPLGMSVWGGLLSLGLGYGYNPDATVGDILRGTGSATVTGAKAVVNGVSQAGVNLVTLGLGPDNVEVWRVNDCDRDNDYDLARGFAMVGGEILTGVLTGGASYASKVGTAVRTIDQAGNVVMAARGAADMLDEGITAENSLRLAGGAFGFGANSVARRAAMGRSADDALRQADTEVVQRAMSRAELAATRETGLLRGGRDGTHYVSDAVNSGATRAQQRLALPERPEVRVTLEVPAGRFSSPTRVGPLELPGGGVLQGGGMERSATGNIPVRILGVRSM